MTLPTEFQGTSLRHHIDMAIQVLSTVIRGSPDTVEKLLVAILAGGHILLEDAPGTGKTTLTKALAAALELSFSRVSFTPDLLPGDLLGMNVLTPSDGSFHFHQGPVFTHILLADEINRASPRTQSALLEAMNERQVSIENETRPLPTPFFVLATQNPMDYRGTYPLPEAQLDRFLMRLSLGYPPPAEELAMLFDRQTKDPLTEVTSVLSRNTLLAAQEIVRETQVNDDVARYIVALVGATRSHTHVTVGASPRATLALFRAAQAGARRQGRDYVIPEDVQRLFLPVLSHRLILETNAQYAGNRPEQVLEDILDSIPVPI